VRRAVDLRAMDRIDLMMVVSHELSHITGRDGLVLCYRQCMADRAPGSPKRPAQLRRPVVQQADWVLFVRPPAGCGQDDLAIIRELYDEIKDVVLKEYSGRNCGAMLLRWASRRRRRAF